MLSSIKLKLLALTLLIASSFASTAQAGCNLSITVKNDFANVPLEIVKIKTAAWYVHGILSTGPLVYKTQWTGSRSIPVGASKTFNFSVNNSCSVVLGQNFWNVKFYRANGKKHNCHKLTKTDSRKLAKPDKCNL